jgi:hypothetical protein
LDDRQRRFRIERRALQLAVLIASIVPVAAGAAGVLDGPRMLHGTGLGTPDLESHFRYLSGLLLGIGFAFIATVPSIERQSRLFATLSVIVVVGGLARLSSAVLHGTPGTAHQLALVMELGVVPALLLWQRRIAGLAP